jgi:two-component system chemotaxis sensor kinase CheA
MSIRMMPMDFVFSRFPRMVRDLAHKLGKKVDFITNGAATELDKGLIERIVDPLTHLVRNSIDHGIEAPHQRQGKAEDGAVTIDLVIGSSTRVALKNSAAPLNSGYTLRR